MDKDDIIKLAREAGMEQDGDNFFSPSHEEIDVHITDLERFAALVAAAERESWPAEMEAMERQVNILTDALAQAKAEEREECAKVCDARYMGDNNREDMEARRCAAAIRARGEIK